MSHCVVMQRKCLNPSHNPTCLQARDTGVLAPLALWHLRVAHSITQEVIGCNIENAFKAKSPKRCQNLPPSSPVLEINTIIGVPGAGAPSRHMRSLGAGKILSKACPENCRI